MPQTGKTRIATPQTRSPTEQTRPACPSHPHVTDQPSNIAGAAPGHLSNPLCARRRRPHCHPAAVGMQCDAAARRKASLLLAADGSAGASSLYRAAPCRAAPRQPRKPRQKRHGITARRRWQMTHRAPLPPVLVARRRRHGWRRSSAVAALARLAKPRCAAPICTSAPTARRGSARAGARVLAAPCSRVGPLQCRAAAAGRHMKPRGARPAAPRARLLRPALRLRLCAAAVSRVGSKTVAACARHHKRRGSGTTGGLQPKVRRGGCGV